MPTKGGQQPQGLKLHPYEAEKLRQCMRNNTRLQQLGLPALSCMFATQTTVSSKRNEPKDRNGEGSDPEYDPEEDDSDEADMIGENSHKDPMASKKRTNTRAAEMPPGGKKPRAAKRIRAEQQTTRVTRSKKSLTVEDDSASTGLSHPEATDIHSACSSNAFLTVHEALGGQGLMRMADNEGDKYDDEDPNAFDLFKECHYSNKKKGYTPSVQLAIRISEAADAEQEPKSVTEVVADVLAEHTKKSKFLINVGIDSARPRTSVVNLEADLEMEKRANAELRMVVNTQKAQIDVLSEQLQEVEQARVKDKEEMQKKQAETDAKLDLLLSQLRASQAD
ncbi:hypothetical protein EJB05_26909, partial [Eragrostis curvula]